MAFVVFFSFFFSSWCTFYLFSNYVFIFYRVHRVLTVANTRRRARTSARRHAHGQAEERAHTDTRTHRVISSGKYSIWKALTNP